MTDGTIDAAAEGGSRFIRMTGSIRYTISAPLVRHIEELEAQEDVEAILVDLTGAAAIDSTNLGLLARLDRLLRRRGLGPVLIHSTNREINRILLSMGFDRVFRILEEAPDRQPAYASLTGDQEGEKASGEEILDSHRRLQQLNEKNRQEFSSLVELLERELHPRRS